MRAATKTIKRSCGHTEIVTVRFTNGAQRDGKFQYLEGFLCSECQHRTNSEKAAELAAAAGLPMLEGSEKQRIWAETIRQEMLREFSDENLDDWEPDEEFDMEKYQAVKREINTSTSAKWFIENRFLDISDCEQ